MAKKIRTRKVLSNKNQIRYSVSSSLYENKDDYLKISKQSFSSNTNSINQRASIMSKTCSSNSNPFELWKETKGIVSKKARLSRFDHLLKENIKKKSRLRL